MKWEEVIEALAKETGKSKKDVKEILAVFVEQLPQICKKNESVRIPGLGTFEMRFRGSRKGRNPKNGKVINIPSSKSLGFRPSKNVKLFLNK